MNQPKHIVPGLERCKNNHKIIYISSAVIFPSKIINIIKNVHDELKILEKKNLIFKDNYIYYINKEKIIVGIYQNSALFKPNYILTYNSRNLEKIEEMIMLSSNINEYLKQRNYNSQSDYQILKNEKDEEICSLIILSQSDIIYGKEIKRKNPDIKNRNYNNDKLKIQTNDDDNKLNSIENQQKQKENELLINYFKFN